MNNMKIDVYTDGSSLGNPGPGGWGCVFVENGKIIRELGGNSKNTTNNIMEMTAVIQAIDFAIKNNIEDLTVYADSAYVLGGITSWIYNWEKNGWRKADKKPVLNKELWQEMIALVRVYKGKISWEKVKGHAGHEYNERADVIATSFSSTGVCDLVK